MTLKESNSRNNGASTENRRWIWIAWTVVTVLVGGLEVQRYFAAQGSEAGAMAWLVYWDSETTLPFFTLACLPLFVALSRQFGRRQKRVQASSTDRHRFLAPGLLIVFSVAVFCSWKIGSTPIQIPLLTADDRVEFAQLPPAYHDEYSYLLQAETYRSGRLTYPAASVRPDLFHQFHVLNETRTVSRYFPWTGCWIAISQSLGNPFFGHWIAGALSAVFFSLALTHITSVRTSICGGLLIAVSPGISVFSNMLLAHHPTMLALSVFTFAFFRMTWTGQLRWAFTAGIGLTLAMLGRPMTAAGFGLPFGIWLLTQFVRKEQNWRLAIGFAIPIALGFVALGVVNNAATGSWHRTAYQEYTERYTPRHRYGFSNGTEQTSTHGPAAVQKYDEWAENLTLSVAIRNVGQRAFASFQWSLSMFPLLFGVLLCLPCLAKGLQQDSADEEEIAHARRRSHLRLLAFSVVSLHTVHVPYWFNGIMEWHYVFETAPLLLMLAVVGFERGLRTLSSIASHRTATVWFVIFTAGGLIPGWVTMTPFTERSKVDQAVSQLAFSRIRLDYFNRVNASELVKKPALVMVDETNSNPQLSYIINPPSMNSEVIVCRLPESENEVHELAAAFPERNLYVFVPEMTLPPQIHPFEFTDRASNLKSPQ